MLRWINDRSFAVAATIIAPITTMTVASTCSSGLGGRKANHTAAVKARAGCDDHAELLPAELSTRTLCCASPIFRLPWESTGGHAVAVRRAKTLSGFHDVNDLIARNKTELPMAISVRAERHHLRRSVGLWQIEVGTKEPPFTRV